MNRNKSDLISIIMPTFNSSDYVERSINSILKQSYTNWELFVCDDASTDATIHKLNKYSKSDSRITILRSPVNRGPSAARNMGIDNCTGNYLAFLDSDDSWDSEFLETQIDFLKKKGAKFVFSSYRRINPAGIEVLSDFIVPEKVDYTDICKTNSISCLTAVVDRSIISSLRMKSGGVEDLNFWLDILKHYPVAYGNRKVLASYTIRSGSRSRNKITLIEKQWNTYRKLQNINFLKSAFYLINWAVRGFIKNVK